MNENENLVVKKLYGLFNVSASKSRTTLILPLNAGVYKLKINK